MTMMRYAKRFGLLWSVWVWLGLGLVSPVLAGLNEWTRVEDGIGASVSRLTFHPGRPDTLFAGAANGFYRSEDAGNTWQPSGVQLVDRSVLSMAVDPSRATRLYAGVNNGLLISDDGGRQWRSVAGISSGVLSVGVGSEGRVYVGTFGQGVYLSEDAGETWQLVGGDTNFEIVFTLAVHPFQSETVYAGTSVGLFVSYDGGASWESVADLAGQSIHSIALSDQVETSAFAAVGTYGAGVFISEDGGANWRTANEGLSDLNVRSVTLDPNRADLLYVATATGGFFRSKDAGRGWTPINTGLADLSARWIGVLPGDEKRIFGLTRGEGISTIQFEPEARFRVDVERLDLGAVGVGQAQSLPLAIYNEGDAPLFVSNISIDRESAFSVTPVSLTVDPGETGSVQVRFEPNASGIESTEMVLRSNDSDQASARIALVGTGVQARLTVQPSALNFGSVRIGSYVDTTVLLSNEGNATLDLRNALFENSAFRVLNQLPTSLSPGQKALVRLRFVPLVARGISSNLIVSASQGIIREVPVDGVGTAADITLSSYAVDFGTVDLMGMRVETIELSNSGNADLNISSLSIEGASFSADVQAPLRIAPGGVREMGLQFSPIEAGVHSAALTIESDALGSSSSTTIQLLGAGGALSLSAQEPILAGSGAADLLVADFNDDGKPDLALADSAGGQVRIHLNDGLGAFDDAKAFPEENTPYERWDRPVALAVAPLFNGSLDLIVADPIAQSISLLSNDGLGAFNGDRSDIYIGHALADVIAADFDADGDADLATANWDDASITVLYNGGRGTFSSRATLRVPEGPMALAASDLNADDRRDLVVANSIDGTVSVLLADREGGFLARSDYAVGLEPVSVQVLDFDADGDNDVLVGNRASRDVSVLTNDGEGQLVLTQRINVNLPIADMYFADLTRDIYSDLVVASSAGEYIAFLENEAGEGFVVRDIIASQVPLRRTAILDVNGDGANDIAALSSADGQMQIFINEDARLGDPPHPPTAVEARDLGRDLGRQIEVVWQAPELDEQLGRTTGYSIFRSKTREGSYESIDTLAAGTRRFIDPAATLADTFFYYVISGNAGVASAPSDTVWAVSQPSPFFELEVANEKHFSIGDTLLVRAYIVPTAHVLTGVSLYMSYDAESLDLVDVLTDSIISAESEDFTGIQPFRLASAFEGRSIQNELHGNGLGKVNLSLAQSMANPLINSGVSPVLLGELRFVTRVDTIALISIDDEPDLNRSSAVVNSAGDWIPPFIPDRPTEIAVRDYSVQGRVGLQGKSDDMQVSLFFYDDEDVLLASPINDEDRFRAGIQHTLDADGQFNLGQIPPGAYRLLVKSDIHLQGHVVGDQVEVGAELGDTLLAFEWVVSDTSDQLPVGDANDDNRINLADFAILVDHFNSTVYANREAVRADFNGDNMVGLDDFMLLAENFGRVGMERTPLDAAKRAAVHALVYLDEGGALRLGQPEDITGLSLLLSDCDAASLSLAQSPWRRGGGQMQAWNEGDATRLLVAQSSSQQALEAVRQLWALPVGAQMVEGHILRADGTLVRLQLDRSPSPPSVSALLPNYPNPFNPETSIPFAVGVGDGGRVDVAIYNGLGQKMRTLFSGTLQPGMHVLQWDGRDDSGHSVATGAYFYRLNIAGKTHVRRLLLLR